MASGDTIVTFEPDCADVPAGGPKQRNRNGQKYLGYDDTTQQWAFFRFIMPRHYSGNGLTVYLHFAMTSAISGNIRAQTKFERIGQVQDVDSDNFAAANSLGDTAVPGTSGIPKIVAIAHANGSEIASIAAGELCRLGVSLYSGSTSNATGNRELMGVEIKET